MGDTLPTLEPVMLRGLSWEQARSNLGAVDCAIRRDHWCNPVVILEDGRLVIDDGDIRYPFTFMRGDRSARDWSMVPRCDEEGDPVTPTYRQPASPETGTGR